MKRLLIFTEGETAGQFEPLDLMRPGFLLRDGAHTNAERWIELLNPSHVRFSTREHLVDFTAELTGWEQASFRKDVSVQDVWTIEGVVQPLADRRWARLDFGKSLRWKDETCSITRCPTVKAPTSLPVAIDFPVRRMDGLWDFIRHLNGQLAFDFALWKRNRKPTPRKLNSPTKGVFVTGDPKFIWLGKNVQVGPHNVIDTRMGPVILDDDVTLEPFNRIDGPAYIGRGTSLLGGKFTGGTAIGPGCKIGGEWEASIAQGFVNKAHAGFFGHGILGEWVNLGAMTTNSDLKNNYGNVRMMRGGREVDTGQIKVGSFLADHTKTGIGTLIPTGATWGVGVNFFGGNLGPKHLPSFVWSGPDGSTEHRIEQLLNTAEAAMSRRKEQLKMIGHPGYLTDSHRALLRNLFEHTATARAEFLKRP